LKVSTYRPSLSEWRSEVRRRARINLVTKTAKKLSKKDNPTPSQWMIQTCQMWLDNFQPVWCLFLHAEILTRLNIVTKAMEQKNSEEKKLLTGNNGNNWYSNNPILRLIHTLDETEIRCS
jgi:hypothetical protein